VPATWSSAPPALRLAPHLLAGAFCAGLLAALALRPPLAAAAGGAGAAALAAAALVRRHRARAAVVALALALGLAGWAWGSARLAATTPPALDLPREARGTLIVEAPPAPDPHGGARARAVAEDLHLAGGGRVPRGTRLLLDLGPGDARPAVGARLRVAGELLPAAAVDAPGWWRAHLARQGIAGRIRPRSIAPAGRRGGLRGARDRWRAWTAANAGAGLSGDRAALVRGMALGAAGDLSESSAAAFRDAGLWHLLAVSGQNVTVVALAVLAALRAVGVGHRASTAAAITLIVAYCLACEGGASVARAGVAGVLGLLAELRSTARERWYLLLVGLAALLAHQPRAAGDPGLQLSFAAVVGLFVLVPPLAERARGWLPARAADLAAMALAAGVATAPVLAWHFERLSLAGLALNVVAVPLAAPVVVLALAGIAAGALLPAAGVALAAIAGLGAELLLLMARGAAAIPGAAVDIPRAAAPALLLLPAAVVLARRRIRLPLPAPALAALLVAGAALAVALTRPPAAPPWPASPALTALDIGQGDALLLRSPNGAAALVDAGPAGEPAPVVAALRRAGVRRLDLVVFTHNSADHVGGVADVLERFSVGTLVAPLLADEPQPPAVRAALEAARRRGVPRATVRAGDRLAVGAWRVRVLWPARRPEVGVDPNLGAMVARASAGGLDALLTADAESPVLDRLAPGRVEVLKVSHHGSEDPGLPGVLRRLRPAVALITVGAGNRYGHPRAGTLAALSAAGVMTWRTDRSGDVTVTGGPGAVDVRASR
jgi:competence protein ComEC